MGLSQVLYNIFFYSGFVGLFIFNLITCKHYGIKKWQATVFTVCVYSAALVWMFFLFWAESGFKNFGGNNIVRIFIWLPVFVIPMAKILKLDINKCLDFVSPCLCINHGLAHIGCIFEGCCHGYPFQGGIYNTKLQQELFPNQLVEAGAALVIAFLIARRNHKRDYQVDGLSFPIMLMMFGYSRVIFEFFRDNAEPYLFHTFLSNVSGMSWCYISTLQIHALVAGIVGTVWYVIAKKRQKTNHQAPIAQ